MSPNPDGWAANRVLGLVAILLGTSCIAALWAFLPLFSTIPGWFDSARLHTLLALAAPLAALTIWILLAFNGYRAGSGRGTASLLLYFAAAIYANYVTSAGLIAGQLGYTLGGAIQRIGPEMAFALWRANIGSMEILLYAVGAGVAVLLGIAPWGRR